MNDQLKSIIFGSLMLTGILLSCNKETVPTITTTEITDITISTANSGGTITDEGSDRVTDRGVCWSTQENPTVNDTKNSVEDNLMKFTARIYGLEAGFTYYARAFATNSVGTGYGSTESFTTSGSKPEVIILPVTNITPTSATFSGNVNPGLIYTNVYFEYGLSIGSARSLAYTGNPVNGSSSVLIQQDVTDLEPGTAYHVRIKAENQLGGLYSEEMTFNTPGEEPEAVTLPATEIKVSEVRVTGMVNANLLPTIVSFEFGTSQEYGSSVVYSGGQVTGGMNIELNEVIVRLQANTTYHFRIKAENYLGVVYGDDMVFTTLPGFTDIDGYAYDTLILGNQIWMQSNLKSAKYNDNTNIPLVTDWTDWISWGTLTSPGYCYYTEDLIIDRDSYGPMYNWFAVNTNKVCPIGWHVPSIEEWNVLFGYLGGTNLAGPKMMETGTLHWTIPNDIATNESGFTAIPGGYRDGGFVSIGTQAAWLSSSEDQAGNALTINLNSNGSILIIPRVKRNGAHIRCLRDN